MRKQKFFFGGYILLILSFLLGSNSFSQQTQISQYVIFGGKNAPGQTTPAYPGYAVQLSPNVTIQGGNIGSYNLVTSKGRLTFSGSIYSGGTLKLSNHNSISGDLAAMYSNGTVISVGYNAKIGGNIDANGNIDVDGGTVSGTVTHPAGTTYSGPTPDGGNISGNPNIPVLPDMPAINNFPAAGSVNIYSSKTITPGSYGNIKLSGNKTLTLSGTGVYIFKSINNYGWSNNFVFDFKNDPIGSFKIYVYEDVDLGRISASMKNGGSESRIYLETHGNGSSCSDRTVAFNIGNGSGDNDDDSWGHSGGFNSKWIGSVWAPYGAINVGSCPASATIIGALWSGTQVKLHSGVSMTFAPFIFCTTPTANVGADQTACSNSGAVAITGASATNQISVSWSSSGTGTFTNGNTLTPSYTPSTADSTSGFVTLTLTAIGDPQCGNATATKKLTIVPQPSVNAGTTVTTCSNSGAINITGGATATNYTSVLWTSSGTGTFSNANSLTNATYSPSAADISAGSVTLTLKAIGNSPCGNVTSTKTLTIIPAPTVSAGTAITICSNNGAVNISTDANAANYSSVTWTSSGTGTFSNPNSLTNATYTASDADIAAGSVTLTVTAYGNTPCGIATDTKILTIIPAATASAGSAISICSNSGPVNVTSGATATNYSSVTWTSSGTGTFSDANSLTNATYTFSDADIDAGSVTLTLTANGNAPCVNAISTKTLTILPTPKADAGPDIALNVNSQANLVGSSNINGSSFSWQAINGGIINGATNENSILATSLGSYILTVTSASGCSSADTALVTGKVEKIIGSELQSVFDNLNPNAPDTANPFFQITPDGYVTIDIIVKEGFYDSVLSLLRTAPYGLIDTITNGNSRFFITGKFPIVNLPKLNLLGNIINYCRPYYQPIGNIGLVNTAGDTTMRSYLVRSGYNVDGTGIKVGVISNSFATIPNGTTATLPLQPVTDPPNPVAQTFTTNTAAQDVSNGDLPATVHVLQDYPIQSSDEGRGMLQIVHDIAPGAELYFRTGFFSPGDFALGIKQLRDAGCNVLVDDVTFITEPFLKDGVVAKTVDTVVSQGVTYFSAAGNFANRSYESDFHPIDATSIGFPGKKAHDFSGSGDMFQKVRLAPGNYTFVFQWVDDIYSVGETEGTKNDMDIYLTKNTDGTGLIGYNRDNTNGDPIEFIQLTVNGTDSVDYNVLIVNNTTTSNPSRIKYIVFRGGIRFMEYNQGNSTLVGQANAEGAIAVGASRFNQAPPYVATPLIESFSSLGGTQTNGVVRQKPDIVGPDGVNTTVRLGQDYPNSALDGYSNFFGTSAAAPHAAAVAALIMQARKKYLGETTIAPSTIRSLLTSTATDMGTPGFDYSTGYGLLNAAAAMRTFAAPTSNIDSLIVPRTNPLTIPGDTVFTVTLKGDNFSNNSTIYFKDSALASTQIVNSNEATAVIPKFDGNPAISLYTPPNAATNGTDGGFSDTLHFFQGDVTVTVENIVKKYGEQLPALDTSIRVNGVLLQDTTLTLADIGLSKLTLTTAATTNSDVGTYLITASGNFDKSDPADSAFLMKFHYKFIPGTVTINKMPLTITPNDKTVNYGQYVGDISFNYDYDRSNVPDAASLDNLIKTYHQSYLPANALAVINNFSATQADGSVLTSNDLVNLNMIASFKAVNKSRKFQLDGSNNLVPLSDPNNINAVYLVDISSKSIYDYKKDPKTAHFYGVYPNINSKAVLGASALSSNTGQVYVNGSLVPMVNGSLVPMVNTTSGSLVPMINGSLVQIINGSLVQLINGVPTPVPNSSLVQLINGSLVQLINGTFQPIPNNSLVQMVNGTLMQMVNGLLVQLVNGSLMQLVNGEYVPIPNSVLVQLVNGSLVQYVNGVYLPVANGSLVQLVNGSLVQMVNGSLVPIINGTGETETPIINSSLVQLVNGVLMQLVNGSLVPLINGSLVQMVNGSLVQYVNGSLVPLVNSSLVQLVNTSLVQFVNGTLVQFVNSNTLGADAANSNTGVIFDTTDVDLQTNWIGPMFGINMITGLNPGQQKLIPGVLANSNFDITYGLGTVTIKPDTITVTVNDTTRQYADDNPVFRVTYSGFASGDSLQNSVTGSPLITTTAVSNSPIGSYPITISMGSLASANYVFKFVNGTLTVTANPCLITHSLVKNFKNTSGSPTSLWFNLTTEIDGQLNSNGDYLLFKAGTISFSNINSNPMVNNLALPNGMIIADNTVTKPITSFDDINNTWITKVPVGYHCHSDIFITGAIINSSNGFIKSVSNASSSLSGIFYSTKPFSSQWSYSLTAYRPQFDYSVISDPGKVASVDGYYRAGTPIPVRENQVKGGSSSYDDHDHDDDDDCSNDNFTACTAPVNNSINTGGRANNTSVPEVETTDVVIIPGDLKVIPNPASDHIMVSFVPLQTGNSKTVLYSIDGRKVFENNNGIYEAGVKYYQTIDISRFRPGVYIVQISGGSKVTSKKLIISR